MTAKNILIHQILVLTDIVAVDSGKRTIFVISSSVHVDPVLIRAHRVAIATPGNSGTLKRLHIEVDLFRRGNQLDTCLCVCLCVCVCTCTLYAGALHADSVQCLIVQNSKKNFELLLTLRHWSREYTYMYLKVTSTFCTICTQIWYRVDSYECAVVTNVCECIHSCMFTFLSQNM